MWGVGQEVELFWEGPYPLREQPQKATLTTDRLPGLKREALGAVSTAVGRHFHHHLNGEILLPGGRKLLRDASDKPLGW